MQPELRALAVVCSVDADFTFRWLIEAAEQIHNRALARACFADERDGLPGLYIQRKIIQHAFAAFVLERHMIEGDIACDGFPVLRVRIKDIAVLLNDLRTIGYIRFGIHQSDDALRRCLRPQHFCENVG
ncbi:hypothetical protein SDC9_152122 [bioreactor metagenome]|uniref:Uncharacterized protein n=1 Tax=bioreactor metagenome TaxID=1076179 RepID=A0A645EWP0_9ZZZZ